MVGRDPSTGSVRIGGMREQTQQALENIKAVLEAAGSSLEKVIKTNCYISSFDDFKQFNEVWEAYFSKSPPARLCVQVGLPPSFVIEIDAIAAVD
jgi:2-iminobutanoate/2-iminopropanoate deaminase